MLCPRGINTLRIWTHSLFQRPEHLVRDFPQKTQNPIVTFRSRVPRHAPNFIRPAKEECTACAIAFKHTHVRPPSSRRFHARAVHGHAAHSTTPLNHAPQKCTYNEPPTAQLCFMMRRACSRAATTGTHRAASKFPFRLMTCPW